MKKLTIPLLLSCFFFAFLIGRVQDSYDRVAPQVLYLSIVNLISLLYLFYNYSLNNIISYVKSNKSFIYYSAYILISGLSIIVADNKAEAIITFSKYATYLTAFLAILVLTRSNKFNITDFFLKIIVASIIIESGTVLYALIDDVIINGNPFYRGNHYSGLAANINIVAFSLVAKSPVIFYYIFKNESKMMLAFLYIVFFMICSSLFFLLTRGALLAFVLISCLIFSYILIKEYKTSIIKVGISIIVFFVSFQFSTSTMNANDSNPIVDRVSSIRLNTSDESINQRLRYYSHSIKMMSKQPLLGIGVGNWKFKSIEYDSKNIMEYVVPYFAHNDFLQIGAEIGILGLVFYLLFIFRPCWILFKKIYTFQDVFLDMILLSMILVCVIDSLLNFPIGRPITHIFLIFLIIVFEEHQKALKI